MTSLKHVRARFVVLTATHGAMGYWSAFCWQNVKASRTDRRLPSTAMLELISQALFVLNGGGHNCSPESLFDELVQLAADCSWKYSVVIKWLVCMSSGIWGFQEFV